MMPDAIALPDGPPFPVALEGASNLRDLGGWPTADRRRVRRGLVFRGATLARLTEADAAVVAALGLRSVCDLRGVREAAAAPSRLADGCALFPLPIEPSVGASLRDLMRRERATGEDVVALLRTAYLDYGTTCIGAYRGLFDRLLTPGALPLLFHCSAGKDRTGLGAALLLLALGCDRDVIRADYVATDRLWRRDYPLPAGTPPAMAAALYATHPDLLDAALDAAIAAHGGADGLLERGLGLDRARLDRLRAVLVD